MRPISLLTLVVAAPLLAGCGSSDAPDGTPGGAPAASAATGGTFSEEIEKRACDLLTPAMVTEAAGMPADGYERSPSAEAEEMFPSSAGRTCTYEWGDDAGSAALTMIDVYDDAERAERFFQQATATTTRGDYARGMDAIGDQVERQREAGELDDRTAEGAGALAEGLGGAMAEGDPDEILSQFEAVAGIGDAAAIQEGPDTTRVMGMVIPGYTSAMWVRRGNVTFLVSALVNGADGEVNAARTAAATRALGRAVAAGLPR